MTAIDIGERLGGVTAQFIHGQARDGLFPKPSMVTPGRRGRHLWLEHTFEFWLSEYDLLREAEPETKRNDLARQATVAAMTYDKQIKSTIFSQYRNNHDARRDPGRESERANGSDKARMVAA